MNKQEREREKEIKKLIYLKSSLIKVTKKELKCLRQELDNLGDNKNKSKVYKK